MCADMETSHPQFLYWSKTLKLEILFLQFMRAQRDGNFLMYLEALGSIVPWMFAMDHFHYARWLSVHVRDLIQLEHECPKVWNEFLKGHFVTQKTSHTTVNAAGKQLFSYGNRKLENIPPSRAALLQHAKHASFQAGHVWGQAMIADPSLPSPSEWGWQKGWKLDTIVDHACRSF